MASTCPVCMAPLPEGANACPTCGFKLLGKTQAFKPNDMTVSRSHAEIRRVNGVFHIVDLDSFNGLWVNNRNVRETRLYDGDVIQIGTFSLAFSPMDPTR